MIAPALQRTAVMALLEWWKLETNGADVRALDGLMSLPSAQALFALGGDAMPWLFAELERAPGHHVLRIIRHVAGERGRSVPRGYVADLDGVKKEAHLWFAWYQENAAHYQPLPYDHSAKDRVVSLTAATPTGLLAVDSRGMVAGVVAFDNYDDARIVAERLIGPERKKA